MVTVTVKSQAEIQGEKSVFLLLYDQHHLGNRKPISHSGGDRLLTREVALHKLKFYPSIAHKSIFNALRFKLFLGQQEEEE